MVQDFRVSTIDVNLKNKSVVITCSMDVNPDTVNDANVQLFSKASRNVMEYVPKLNGKILTLELIDWPEPNFDYVIVVQNLKSVLGDDLVSGVRRKIIFESSICSKLEITYPAYDEVITDLKVAWEEILASDEHEYINSYYVEISTDNSFYHIVKKVEVVDRDEIDLSELLNGQYYVRGRVQKDNEYGSWGEIVTFIIGDKAAKPGPIFDSGESDQSDDDDIYIPEIKILTMPVNGETPESFLIEFDCEIDPDSIEDIIVIRRSI